MKLPRLITRRRAKLVGLIATMASTLLYAAALSSGWSYEHFQYGRRISLWLMRGRIEAAWYNSHWEGTEPPPLVLMEPWPSRSFDTSSFYYAMSSDKGRRSSDSFPWFTAKSKFSFDWQWHENVRPPITDAYIAIPLWLPLVLIAAPTVWLWRTGRRAKPWQCDNCRYDLRGLERESKTVGSEIRCTVCPECGTTKKP